MIDSLRIAHHEAAHAIVGMFFGMRVTSVVLEEAGDSRPSVVCDQTGVKDRLPGGALEKLMLWDCLRVMQLAAGGCAELRLGHPHEECGWQSDMRQFQPLIVALARCIGRSYDDCWWFLSDQVEQLLWNDRFWTIVTDLAEELHSRHIRTGDELEAQFRPRILAFTAPQMSDILEKLGRFTDTPTLRSLARDEGFMRSLGSLGNESISG